MKKFTSFISLLIIFLPGLLFANAYVHGTVKYANGVPAVNYPVYIAGDSLVGSSVCYQRHIRYTNVSGMYTDTLFCNNNLTNTNTNTWVYTANNNIISHLNTFNANQVAESNFILPDTINAVCRAIFSTYSATSNQVYFNSSNSYGSQPADSIVQRNWTFGDGTVLGGNVVAPTHVYTIPGVFSVCLRIRTLAGCENTYCYNVTIANIPNCSAILHINQISPFRFAFVGDSSRAGLGDNIISYKWKFGNGDSAMGGYRVEYTYPSPGTYTACLTITTRFGCVKTVCQTINVGSIIRCRASFINENIAVPSGGNTALKYKRFLSTSTTGLPDSIINTRWTFGDGSLLVTSADTRPTHGYAQTGIYTVCLKITSASGCVDSTCQDIIVRDSTPTNTNCQPRFATTANGLLVTFNANTSIVAAGDSVISRSWNFGDGVTINNNAPVLTHQYPRAGIYQACFTIRTRSSCVATVCKQVVVITVSGNCVPFFTKEQIAATPKTIRFNSSAAYSQIPNDSIIARKWEFGDGQILLGNVVNPLHTYLRGGTYTACLTIITAHCDKRWCQTIQVLPLDSTNNLDSVSIVSLYPVPVTSPLNVVLHSSHANVNAQLAIYDVYGVLKSTQSVVLPLGNSNYSIPTAQLAAGPYIFKLTTIYGIKSRSFYKL